jgi:hypothetical protein
MNKARPLLTAVTLLSISLISFQLSAEEAGDAAAATPSANAPAAAPAATNDHVARAVFTSNVQGREPVDTITSLSNDKNQIYFFSDLRGLGGQTVTHRWEYQGKPMGEVTFNVGGPRWRVWSSKTLIPHWTGEWRVSIIDGAGNTVGEASFNYTAATPQN